jgi:hypothetical protein
MVKGSVTHKKLIHNKIGAVIKDGNSTEASPRNTAVSPIVIKFSMRYTSTGFNMRSKDNKPGIISPLVIIRRPIRPRS